MIFNDSKRAWVFSTVLALTTACLPPFALAQNEIGANDAPVDAVPGAQVPPPNAPLWGDARLEIPAHNYPLPSAGKVLIVSPEGRDDGAGTLASPLSVAKAFADAPTGATIVLRGGVYRVGSFEIKNKALHLQAYQGEKPWLKGSVVVPNQGWQTENRDGKTLYFREGWNTLLGGKIDPTDANLDGTRSKEGLRQLDGSKNALANLQNQLFLDGKALREVADFGWKYTSRDGIAVEGARTAYEQLNNDIERSPNGTFWVDSTRKRLYLSVNPAGKLIESTVHAEGLLVREDTGFKGTARGFSLRGIGLAHYGDTGLVVIASSPVLENSAFVWCGAYGAVTRQAAIGTVVRGSTFSCNGRTGLRPLGRNTLIEDSTFSFNNTERFSYGWDAAGIKMTHGRGFVFRRNLLEGNNCMGLWIDIDVNDCLVYGNTARNNLTVGIFFEISKGALIAFNLCHDNGEAGIGIANSLDAQVWQNTLVRNRSAVAFRFSGRKNDAKYVIAGVSTGGVFQTTGHVLKNNLYADVQVGKTTYPLADLQSAPSKEMIAESDFNGYFRTQPGATFPASLIKWKQPGGEAKTYASFAEFLADASTRPYERNSIARDGAALFVDAPRGDFRLLSQSPASETATPMPPAVAALAQELNRASAMPFLGAFPPRN